MLLSGIEVYEAWGWKPGDDEFIPTSLFFDSLSDVKRLTVLPYLAIEVLSTDFAADTIRKFAKYAAAGLERYWIVDPEEPVIVVYHLDDGIYGEIPRHQPGETAELNVGPARVTLDPGAAARLTFAGKRNPRLASSQLAGRTLGCERR